MRVRERQSFFCIQEMLTLSPPSLSLFPHPLFHTLSLPPPPSPLSLSSLTLSPFSLSHTLSPLPVPSPLSPLLSLPLRVRVSLSLTFMACSYNHDTYLREKPMNQRGIQRSSNIFFSIHIFKNQTG